MNLGCSGFIYGLRLADSLIQSGVARHVLLITADTYSKVIHPRDRAVRTLFGDGAAATLVSRASSGPGEIGEFVLGTNGDGAEKLIVPSGGFRLPRSPETAVEDTDNTGCVRSRDHLYMDGKAVFGFALSVVPRLVIELLEKASLTLEQIDWYVYHQANKYMLDNLMARSKVPQEKQVWFMNDVGNTVSASIPIALQGYVECGRICSGHRLMLIGFGVGYSWGACIIDWG
jgi:3-oxoacyl-[acyl-carrier-protein] synthase-3